MTEVRLFVADTPTGGWTELTNGEQRTVRITAPDLQRARRARARIREGGVDLAVILDVAVAVASDFRSARATFCRVGEPATIEYAGTVDGLAGLIADIHADGVTLIPASPRRDLRAVGLDVLDWLAIRGHVRAS